MIRCRWVDLGAVEPGRLHASYAGLAEAQPASADPLLVTARSTAGHVSIGACQSEAAELDLAACAEAGVSVIPRPLGGGNVWIDQDQHCLFIILPRDWAPRRPDRGFDLALEPLLRLLAGFGLAARRRGRQDLWVDGRKILGSGAGTVGQSLVIGTSLLWRFPLDRFVGLLRVPSAGFRDWLAQALSQGVTDWQAQGVPVPDDASLASALSEAFEAVLGWRLQASVVDAREQAAIEAAREDMIAEPDHDGQRHVRHGLKINHGLYLLESGGEADWVRVLWREGRVARIASAEQGEHGWAQACVAAPAEREALVAALAPAGGQAGAVQLAERIHAMCPDLDDSDDRTDD